MAENLLNVISLLDLDAEADGVDGALNEDLLVLIAADDQGGQEDLLAGPTNTGSKHRCVRLTGCSSSSRSIHPPPSQLQNSQPERENRAQTWPPPRACCASQQSGRRSSPDTWQR